jgi:hypothetical protein
MGRGGEWGKIGMESRAERREGERRKVKRKRRKGERVEGKGE